MKSVPRFAARILTGSALIAAFVLGTAALVPPPVEAGPCLCPQIYAPVICDNGKTYPNQCVADCKKAKNCVPTGTL